MRTLACGWCWSRSQRNAPRQPLATAAPSRAGPLDASTSPHTSWWANGTTVEPRHSRRADAAASMSLQAASMACSSPASTPSQRSKPVSEPMPVCLYTRCETCSPLASRTGGRATARGQRSASSCTFACTSSAVHLGARRDRFERPGLVGSPSSRDCASTIWACRARCSAASRPRFSPAADFSAASARAASAASCSSAAIVAGSGSCRRRSLKAACGDDCPWAVGGAQWTRRGWRARRNCW